MRLQARFLLLYIFLFGAVATLLIWQRNLDLDRSRFVLQNELRQRQGYFEKILNVEGQPLESLSVDYSFWDEMVTFVQKRNLKFAQNNIDTALETFKADAAWVYRPDRSLVYFKAADGSTATPDLNLPPVFFDQLFITHFKHFFIEQSGGFLEIRAATIHPGNDTDHKTTPQGYWIVGRFWDEDVISSLGNLTQSTVHLSPVSAQSGNVIGTNYIAFSQALRGWDNQPVANLVSTAEVPVVQDLKNLYDRQLALLAFFTLISILIIMLTVWLWVIRPMRQISRSLHKQHPQDLDQLAHHTSEFGKLAQTIQLFYRQKVTIQESDYLKNKLLELNRSKGEFMAIAAHELKGPVGNVHIFAANLADLIHDGTSKKNLLHETERITQQARKATILINDMYQASKGGQFIDFKHTEFDFDGFIRQEVENAQSSTPQHIVLTGQTDERITSDDNRLSQVMANLLRNASKYSSPTSTITVSLSATDNDVIVEVSDTGIGITPQDQIKLFERFYRSSKVTTSYPGLGLGLSVCKEIIEALGGKIWVRSAEGKGSHFYFSLPISSHERDLTPRSS